MSENKKIGKLILVRHHESEWNKLGKWTGLTDVGLSPYGVEKSKEMGSLVKDICFDYVFESSLVRTEQTFTSMLHTCTVDEQVKIIKAPELNERDYGDYTGKNKWEMKELLGEEKFKQVRRSWDEQLPNGESLKMVYERSVPYFLKEVVPLVLSGKNVAVIAHGNSLRSIIKYIESISDEKIADLEFPFGAVFIYELDSDGRILHKEVRSVASDVPA